MTYRVELIPSEEGYAVSVPDLPGVHSHGETEDEALANIRGAIHDYVGSQPKALANKLVRFVSVPTDADGKPLEFKTANFALPPEWTDHKFSTLMEILEGPNWI